MGLAESWGEEFERLYESYERQGLARRVVKARDLFLLIVEVQKETGGPYILYKDACNAKSNQKNLGTIQCSNLCTEVVQYTAPDEVAVCNLASLSLPYCVRVEKGEDGRMRKTFDFERLVKVTRVVVRNLERLIDITDYPLPEARRSNSRHRPMGIGAQVGSFLICSFPPLPPFTFAITIPSPSTTLLSNHVRDLSQLLSPSPILL